LTYCIAIPFEIQKGEVAMSRRKLVLNLGAEEKKDLTAIIRAKTSEQRMVERCSIILMTDEGKTLDEIADALNISRATVNLWRQKFLKKRMEGLKDEQRPGRPRNFTSEERLKVIARACQKPENMTRWSTRDLAEALKGENLKISKSTVNRILLEADLKPHKVEMWLSSKDPEFNEKSAQVVGLYANPFGKRFGHLRG